VRSAAEGGAEDPDGPLRGLCKRVAAYNRRMFEAMKTLAERSVMERAVLLLNHVISAEPQAMERLRAHAARTLRIELEGWPALLPAPSPIAFRITPPGLVEWVESPTDLPADLRVAIDAANPALAFARFVVGERPPLRVEGDAAFATDVNWLIENLRWEVQDDLARLVGDAPAREIGRFGNAVAKAIRDTAKTLDGFARRGGRPGSEPPSR
jgi:ubiquinone biosynthesis accessory factor UbiJ